MSAAYVIYGAAGSGSVPVEAALTLAGRAYDVVERPAWEPEQAEAMAAVNPLKQIPALALPTGELMTESAAILMHLAESHALGPRPGEAMRPRFLRWMAYVSSQIYGLYWIRDVPGRIVDGEAQEALVRSRTAERIADCWRMMGDQLQPAGDFLLGDEISVLDLYVAVVSRWGPRRRRFYDVAPSLAAAVRRVDAEPRLQAFWAARFPFEDGWEG